MNLSKRNVLITGGGTGIGKGIALAMAAAGAKVAIAGRRKDVLTATAAEFTGQPPILCHEVDVTDRGSVRKLVDWAVQELGQIDILINSAGTNIAKRTMVDMIPEDWDRVMAINATGAYNCMYAVLPAMRARRDGLIINISSIAGKRAAALGGVAYCASKFAMTALGTAVGNELGGEGIRVTNVYPGEVDTPILENRPTPVTDEHRSRILQPEDFGNLAVAIAALPPRAHVPEIIVKPTLQGYV
ncbi:MAG: SDR family NAD(P)-dependent oxidoreductase [Planctomycetales bacterium]|nr:SDR family NAD(P)-dependent oxidoreductase [Planctomycetales bacterium]